MKLALAVLVAIAALSAATPEETAVLGAFETWKQAALKGDATTLTRLYHAKLAYTHSNGSTQDKAATVTAQSNPTNIYKGIEIQDLQTTVIGNTAILRYRMDLTHYAGDVAHLHEVMVWVKSADGWQMVTRHATRVPQPVAK